MKHDLGLLALGMLWAGLSGAAAADCCGPPSPAQIAALENAIKAKLPAPLEHYRRIYVRYADVESENPILLRSRIMAGVLIAMAPGETGSAQGVAGLLPPLQGEGCVVAGAVTCTAPGFWLPAEAEIARLERALTLPYRWDAPSRYSRYYSGITDMNGVRRIKAVYERPASGGGALHIVTVPQIGLLIQDLGCSRLTATFDAQSGKLLDSECGALPREAQ